MKSSISKLRSSVRKYLEYQNAERAALKLTLDKILTELPNTVIFGGMLRDFALGKARKFDSDIDLVAFATQQEIANVISEFWPTKNKFGGFRFSKEKHVFDIWAFEDTWAFKAGFVDGKKFPDLLKTTFFDIDSFAYNPVTHKCYYSDVWVKAVESKTLNINLPHNPSPQNMIRRAVRLCCSQDLGIGKELAEYIVLNMRLQHFGRLEAKFLLSLREHFNSGVPGVFRYDLQSNLQLANTERVT